MKIRISFKTPQELEKALKLLSPIISSYKVSKRENGAYRRAYIDTKKDNNQVDDLNNQ